MFVAKTPFSSVIGHRDHLLVRGAVRQLVLGPVGAPRIGAEQERDAHKCTCSLLPERVLTTSPI